MDHEQAIALLPELHEGTLEPARRADLEGHLEGCAECRELSETWADLDAALREHPPATEIVALALGSSRRVEQHVRECPPCADEVDRTRRAHSRAPAHRGWSRATGYMAIAASLLLVVLAWDDARLRQRPAADTGGTGGAVELKVLSSALRGEGAPETIRVGEAQPFVPIALEVDRAATLSPGDEVRFEIRSADRTTIWSLTLPGARVQQDLRATGIVTLLVPAPLLAAGPYGLAVRSGDVELLDVEFRIDR